VQRHKRERAESEGEFVVGRHPACQLVLDSPLVSRCHARLLVTPTGVVVEDMHSRNGVLVNGTQITGGVTVLVGDHIRMGDQDLELVELPADQQRGADEDPLRTATTLAFEAVRTPDSEQRPRSAQAFELLGPVVDKALALGRTDEAERLLAGHLQRVLAQAKQGRALPAEVPEVATGFAIRLARVTSKAGWIDYVIQVYLALGQPLPMEVIHELYTLLRKVRGVDVGLLRQYVALLQSRVSQFGPAQRFAVKRIEGLPTLTGL
jgi:hypothetical protein